MTTVTTWSAREADFLREALRQTNEGFAEKLGISTRAVAKWRGDPEATISLEIQQLLDTVLEQLTDAERERFERLAGVLTIERDMAEELRRRLATATNLHSALAWLQIEGRQDVASDVLDAAVRLKAGRLPRWRGTDIDRSSIADVLNQFYAEGFGDQLPVSAAIDGRSMGLTILSAPTWLDGTVDLHSEDADARFGYDHEPPEVMKPASAVWRRAAESRLAECLVDQTRFVDGRLYRMTGVRSRENGGVTATFTLGSFAQYALTSDLLEAETYAAVQAGGGRLPLREQLLPTVESVLAPAMRTCMGGPLALAAFARPSYRGRPPDFALLVQERGARVLNASRRLAVIPKCFHEPTAEPAWDVNVETSLSRELEEELFGKAEVDSTQGGRRIVDPMHPDRLTPPMRYLVDAGPEAWSMECTGFGFNLITGNYEFPCLVAVGDEGFWQRYGGEVEANWESESVRIVSSQDRAALGALALDPAWSDEGLFAFLLGLRRLHELHPDRVALPEIEIGFNR